MTNLDVEAISRQYFSRIHRAALVLTGSPWDADDLAQETFLVLARQPQQFQGRSQIYTWLYGILLNLDRRRRRRQGTQQRKLQVIWNAQQQQPPAAPAADFSACVAEWKKSLWAVVDQLPAGQREALVLRYSEGLPYDEIAAVMQCPLGTVKSRIYHGLGGLRRLLDEQDKESLQPPQQSDNMTG